VSSYSVLDEASVVGVSEDVEVPRTEPDAEVEVSGIDEDVASSVVAGASGTVTAAPVTGSFLRPKTMRSGHSDVEVASV
jgi:hypothetical protein